ncbi:DUF418 domain-containing protein YeiB [Brenneria salicis]|uniref:DUF418 domain-containing protein n=1 Tax=Brenneria salicis ATCC 15712 = DSM 30166 TaxID=714314 RepID=A0A366HWR2_9GAMM|nr:DUF418 domain-containing protein YeiB [Brenneria salicis]RBP57841.1 uncharacterized protein DES54_1587 [Brenneria salicis ATCC 15712 = DSM 30166]RLM28896.1 hypothetical protein BHG07_16445 [Brenneria salicis ATCC 15712 = DSM 30166]
MSSQSMPPSRIATLDFARGVAVLGILLLNITAFGLPKAAYLNPAYQGPPSLSDVWTWVVMDLLVQAKFLTLFSILFGAGLHLLLPRGKRWVHARLFWLMLIGLGHAIFFWDGDILLDYGLMGLVCYGMIRLADDSRALLRTGAIMYLAGICILLVLSQLLSLQPGRFWLPSATDIANEVFWQTSGGPLAWRHRVDLLTDSLLSLGVQYGWLLAGLMLLGAGLMRSGWLKGEFSPGHYRKMALWLIPLALMINSIGVTAQWLVQWEYRWSGLLLQIPRELSAPLQAVGYLALCYGFWPMLSQWRITHWIGDVGRMALSNYLLQTLLCTALFNHLGFFMSFDRLQLAAIVPCIWTVNLVFSHYWLRYFRQGPIEWLWRQLTAAIARPA